MTSTTHGLSFVVAVRLAGWSARHWHPRRSGRCRRLRWSRTWRAARRRHTRHPTATHRWGGGKQLRELRLRLRRDEREESEAQRIDHVLLGSAVAQPSYGLQHRRVHLFERVLIVRTMLDRDLEAPADALLIEQALFARVRPVGGGFGVGNRSLGGQGLAEVLWCRGPCQRCSKRKRRSPRRVDGASGSLPRLFERAC